MDKRRFLDRMTSWQDENMTRWQDDKMTIWQNGRMARNDLMTWWVTIRSKRRLAATVHQQHQHFSSISAAAASAHQQHQRISSNSASAATLHQQHQRISSISILAASVTCTGRDICPYTSINSDHISLYTLTPPDTTRHASDTTRHHQTCTRQYLIGWQWSFVDL